MSTPVPLVRQLALATNVGLLLLVGLMVWRFTGTTVSTRVSLPAERPPVAIRAATRTGVSRWSIFGSVADTDGDNGQSIATPTTRLDLKLKGILVAADPVNSKAIIATANGAENAYRPGDRLDDETSVDSISRDEVILIHAGRKESLYLVSDGSGKPDRAASAASKRPVISVAPNQAARNLPGGIPLEWTALANSLPFDPLKVAAGFNATPYREQGKLVGYRLSPGRDGRLYRKLGIQPSDVIMAVNGIRLSGVTSPMEVVGALGKSSQIHVEIRRNGKMLNKTVDLNQ